MKWKYRWLFGADSRSHLFVGITRLALVVPGYSQVRQTVSEIGEVGSPARVPFAIMLCCVAACIMVFALAVRDISVEVGHSQLAAYFIGFMALPAAGIGIFAYPHPLHNVFGISELISYQAPLFLVLTWRRDPRARPLVWLSWILYLVIYAAIALNLSSLDRQGPVWTYVKPAYGWRKEQSLLLGLAGAPWSVCCCFGAGARPNQHISHICRNLETQAKAAAKSQVSQTRKSLHLEKLRPFLVR
jgi:hypothetical membrane protein